MKHILIILDDTAGIKALSKRTMDRDNHTHHRYLFAPGGGDLIPDREKIRAIWAEIGPEQRPGEHFTICQAAEAERVIRTGMSSGVLMNTMLSARYELLSICRDAGVRAAVLTSYAAEDMPAQELPENLSPLELITTVGIIPRHWKNGEREGVRLELNHYVNGYNENTYELLSWLPALRALRKILALP